MPSLRSAQVNNNKVTAVNNSGGGVVEEVTNNEGSPDQQVSPSEVQYSSRTGVNDIQNNGCCSESSDIATDDISPNTLSSIRNNNNDVTTNSNQLTTIKTKDTKNKNNDGTFTFNGKQSTNKQGDGINGSSRTTSTGGGDCSIRDGGITFDYLIPLVEEQLRIEGYEMIDDGVFGRCIIRNALVDAGREDELSSLGRVHVATNNLIYFNQGKKILSWDVCIYALISTQLLIHTSFCR